MKYANEAISPAPSYNNCFTVGCKSKNEDGSYGKIAAYFDPRFGIPRKLFGGVDGKMRRYYKMTYEQAKQAIETYLQGDNLPEGAKTLRVSLYLDNAMFGNLHIFVIDFDKWDEESAFFQSAKALADKVTRSQGGGYHMFYGVDKEKATPLFDSINLLTAKGTKSFVSKTKQFSPGDKDKVDMFCDARQLIYEWEPWDNSAGLTDKTQELYELIKANFSLKRPTDFDEWENADDGSIELEGLSEEMLKQKMNEKQKAVFEDLKTISCDCSREMWFRTGIDIYHVFDEELGGSVFLWWSKPGKSYKPQGCARTWNNVCRKGPKKELQNMKWRLMTMTSF